MEPKDYFSSQSKSYAAFRPGYPDELYQFIFQHLKKRDCAWDCATGNGQVASYLAKHFDRVYATDISQEQLNNAVAARNISYSVSAAEHTAFENNQFDLITVAQALHWFNSSSFYKEVRRTCKPGGLLAVWGYSLLTIDPFVDDLFLDFYNNTVGPYWDEARKLVENHYRDIPFPFEEITCPQFFIRINWTAEQLLGYLSSWSATQKYKQVNHKDPVEFFSTQLRSLWKPGEVKVATFPIFMKLGSVTDDFS